MTPEADILDTLRSTRGAWSLRRLVEDTGRDEGEVADAVGRLVVDGLAVRAQHGWRAVRPRVRPRSASVARAHVVRHPGVSLCGAVLRGDAAEGATPCRRCAELEQRAGTDVEVGAALRALRVALGASVAQVARAARVRPDSVTGAELGERARQGAVAAALAAMVSARAARGAILSQREK